ncbi:hypothetical protein MUP32_02110 [Candidatus Microgenomates bacterium]|nr:hypothetical protein [Candidatus Microgenomates bacterium]
MNTAQNNGQKNTSQTGVISSGISKEHEARGSLSAEAVSEISTEVELPKEVEQAGVQKFADTIELPPDLKKLGVGPSGSTTPVTQTAALPPVVLPISDQTVVQGLHTQITNALRWLAVWCVKKLKKAHVALKVIHGKIVRVKTT